MKKLIVASALLGLLLTGCSQDEQKIASSSNSSSKSDSKDKVAANANAPAPAPAPAPADSSAAVALPSSSSATASSTPSASPASTADPKPADASATATASTTTPATDPQMPKSTSDDAAKSPTPPTAANTAADSPIASGSASLVTHLTEWKLTPDDIRDEFNRSGRIERTKPIAPGAPTGPMDNSLITSLVDGKIKADAILSSQSITVETNNGTVTLSGAAHGLDQIGRAMACALETEGVTKAISTVRLGTDTP